MSSHREELLYDFIEALRQLSRLKWHFGSANLPLEDFLVLDLIIESGPCSMKEVIAGLSLAPSTATGIVDRLVDSGYVQRRTSETDRRKVIVEATRKGIHAHNRFRIESLSSVEESLCHLNDEEIRFLLDIMHKLIQQLKR